MSHVVPPELPYNDEFRGFLRRSDSARNAIIKYAKMKLFWPGARDTSVWTLGQVGIGFLQRDWLHSDDDTAWVWEKCVCPLFELSRAGREMLKDGTIGPDLMYKLVDHLVNPSHPGAFQAYIHCIPRRLLAAKRKSQDAFIGAMPDAVTPYRDFDRFMAFVRKRKNRRHPGIHKRNGRLVCTPEVGERLQQEWVVQEGRKKFIRNIAERMIGEGASVDSALRQAMRWLREAGSPAGAKQRYEAWRKRR